MAQWLRQGREMTLLDNRSVTHESKARKKKNLYGMNAFITPKSRIEMQSQIYQLQVTGSLRGDWAVMVPQPPLRVVLWCKL